MAEIESSRAAHTARAQDFQDLMRRRVDEILLVASAYDSFILEEEGALNERILGDFLDLGLRHVPGLTRVSSPSEALARVREERRFNLVISAIQVGDMDAVELARAVHAIDPEMPVVLLAHEQGELAQFLAHHELAGIERAFLWQGDVRILLAISKYVEDKLNAAHDCGVCGVPLILVVEDSIRYWSSFLPVMYTELVRHSQAVISEGLNAAHRLLRLRARPKLLLASSFEEAWDLFNAYQDLVLGILSDIEFPRDGESAPGAGADLARKVREVAPDVPIVLHSSRPAYAEVARQVGAPFLLKGSPTLLTELRRILREDFGFGDFVFRLRDGSEVARAHDLRSLEDLLPRVPVESIAYHGERHHFSKWLRARTEFALAHRLRARVIGDYPDAEAVRTDLIQSIADYRRSRRLALVSDFERTSFDATDGFHRIGGGSLGGKARGLAFVRKLLSEAELEERFPGVRVRVPPGAVIGTDQFDEFLQRGDLHHFAIQCEDPVQLRERMLAAPLPGMLVEDLRALVERIHEPLAVRSSSLLEDSQFQSFSGVYETYMLPNCHPELEVRLQQLLRAIKGVYASTFGPRARAYIRATPYRLEEEKMAVMIQRLVGARHDARYYPDFSGVARSYNFYPSKPLLPEDGMAAVALGLGRTVVSGGNCLRFCPRYPRHLVQFSSVADMLENSQRTFWGLELAPGRAELDPDLELHEAEFGLDVAEADGALTLLGSTWSAENDVIYDGISRPGARLVSFAGILKQDLFPLAELLEQLLALGAEGMGRPVEMEFAVDLKSGAREPAEFGFLQLRPLALSQESGELDLASFDEREVLCRSTSVLGNGRIEHMRDIVVVDAQRFDRSRSAEAALEVARCNAELQEQGRPYVLIGVGRWGSADPWLGIPVTWEQISGARAIVESGFRDTKVAPSQGSHFFHSLSSFQIGYFTVNPESGDGWIDWTWLEAQPAERESVYVRHLRLAEPLRVLMNGRAGEGVILKPAAIG
jgi:CheY-like chemotaxis protein